MAKDSNTYDICIIGAGIAGLYVATELLRARRGLRVCIADKYKFLGGRVMTFRADISGVKYQWEEGAARISEHHTMVLNLLKRYKLHTIPITGEPRYRESGAYPVEPDLFSRSIPVTVNPFGELDERVLQGSTLRSLFHKVYSPKEVTALCDRYPYRAEINTLRADMGVQVFEHEFGLAEKYVVCKEGLGELIERMVKDFEDRGGIVLRQHELVELPRGVQAIFKKGSPSEGESRPDVEISAKNFVFAIPSENLGKIPQFARWSTLKKLKMKPLLRLYAAFPVSPSGKPWFEGMGKIVTAQAPRFIIPAGQNSLQISYTDSEDAEALMKILEDSGEDALGKKIVEDLRLLFHDTYTIPDPLFVKAFPWKQGVTYWLPGDDDPYEESRAALSPLKEFPNWFVCGESYSTRQCWMEGAIEHAKMVLKKLV